MTNDHDVAAARGQLSGDAAEVYEAFFVPALFAQWPSQVLAAGGVRAGDRVLDVGCGTGIATAAAAGLVGPGGHVTGVDPNESMLAVARRRTEPVEWRVGAAEALPFADASFDRVVSQFAVMFFADRAQGLEEMARVLASGGTVAIATWASVEHSPGYAALLDLVGRVVGPDAATALAAPFSLGQPDPVHELVAGAFADVHVATRPGVATFASIAAWVHTDVCGWTLAGMVDDDCYDRLVATASVELGRFTDGAGRVRFDAPALIATGRRQ
ncbi:MAG TPA: methyltransferase domain-containing protein [Ilumatobacteraceae bacterium]|nr:methyltransferase domain-containing protein [Ilumatobacteraceae bacterium]